MFRSSIFDDDLGHYVYTCRQHAERAPSSFYAAVLRGARCVRARPAHGPARGPPRNRETHGLAPRARWADTPPLTYP